MADRLTTPVEDRERMREAESRRFASVLGDLAMSSARMPGAGAVAPDGAWRCGRTARPGPPVVGRRA